MTVRIDGTNTSAAPGVTGADTDTGIKFGTNEVDIVTGGTDRVKVDSSGNVGINELSPTQNLHVHDSGFAGVVIQSDRSSGNIGGLILQDSSGNNKANVYGDVGGALVLGTDAEERMRIDNSGRLLVGAASNYGLTTNALLAGDAQEGILSIINDGDTFINTNDSLGTINFGGHEAGGTAYIGASISADADSVWTGDSPSRLVFKVTADGALGSPTEALRINRSGDIRAQRIYDSTTTNAANVFVTSNGTLARSTSSAKYKTNVETLQDSYADAVLGCRSVWYRSITGNDNPEHGYWGFIAEEVAQVDPRLVFWKTTESVVQEDGTRIDVPCEPEPEGVQYDRFVPHLLNVIKRQGEAIKTLETKVAALEGGAS